MLRPIATAILASALVLPTLASAQTTPIPIVRIQATVTGTWVLDPLACPDIREDIRDARRTTSRYDRREDRRDRRLIDCPPRSWRFVPDAGQAPNRPIRVRRDGSAHYVGDGPLPYIPPPPQVYRQPYQGQSYTPQYVPQGQYQAPAYTPQPRYQAPSYDSQPTYIPTTPIYQ